VKINDNVPCHSLVDMKKLRLISFINVQIMVDVLLYIILKYQRK